jgi:hypothetical protein
LGESYADETYDPMELSGWYEMLESPSNCSPDAPKMS